MNEGSHSSSSPSWAPAEEAQELFAQYLYRRDVGEEADFERLVAEHPEHAGDLRALLANWQGVANVLQRLGETPSAAERARAALPEDEAAGKPSTLPDEASWIDDEAEGHLKAVLARLARRWGAASRYREPEKLDEGGQGTILRVWDEDIGRHLAMKVMRSSKPSSSDARRARSRSLGRFLEEAQVTGQLDHPGIVPVHELGLDSDGRVYFTMKLVQGQDLRAVLRLARKGAEGWSRTRVLGVLLRTCEALAYAHSKDVVHRDLKPSNVMVGRFGEVYVMDWGLARVMTRPDHKDVRIQPRPDATQVVHMEALDESPLRTMDGDVIGTPAYMSPEQASGLLDCIGPATDVYAVGAMLYELLAGRMPYEEPSRRLSNYAVLVKLQKGPPRPVAELAPDAPPELVAICEKAMARDVDARYPSTRALADDLRAYLETRVVEAYRTGPVVELQKWVQRNRATAAAVAALLVVVLGAALAVAAVERQRRITATRDLDRSTAEVLLASFGELYPVHPDRVPAMEAWLASARRVVDRRPRYEAELAELERASEGAERVPLEPWPEEFLLRNLENRRSAFADLIPAEVFARMDAAVERGRNDLVPAYERELIVLEGEVPRLDRRIAALRAELASRRTFAFADPELEHTYDLAFELVRDLVELETRRIPEAEELVERAARLHERSIEEHRARWDNAIASIRDREACPLYDGLEIVPQLGLVPLGRDPASGLWEFWHVLSGERPERDEEGRLRIEAETGIVLVLVPGGRFHMGAQSDDPQGPNFVPLGAHVQGLADSEGPVHEVELEPYLLAKHELTVAQWERLTGAAPNEHFPGFDALESPMIAPTNPVEHVSWEECATNLDRWGLCLPTEAQWERAARAGTETTYWSGHFLDSLAGAVNFADLSLERTGFVRAQLVPVDDGHALHGEVDAFRANPWGLQGISGNVWEWCRDWYEVPYPVEGVRPGDGEHVPLPAEGEPLNRDASSKTMRGGSFKSSPADLRVSRRYKRLPSARDDDLGVRPSRALDPEPASR